MTTEVTLQLERIGKVFPASGRQGAVVALDGLDLTVHRGEFLALVGPSGSGKSTVIDLVAGFTQPTSGSLRANGKSIQGPGPDRVVVFQDHAVFPWYTALGNVAYGLRRQGLSRQEAEARALEALAKTGLADFAHAYPATLSGGMRQRVALARALVLRPDILLLDEPFAALDAVTRARLQDELLSLWQEFGWTVVFVTHTLAEAVYLADRVAVLDRPPQGLRGERILNLPRPRLRNDARLTQETEALAALLGGRWHDEESCVCARIETPLET